MDLMRTLLIYMSATMALAVQNTTAPKDTPVPTPAPNAVVETVKAPALGEGITPAPVPTITPNMKGYHNLTMGAVVAGTGVASGAAVASGFEITSGFSHRLVCVLRPAIPSAVRPL